MYWFGVWFGRIEKNDLQLVYTRLNQLRTHVLSQSMSTKGWLLSVMCVCVSLQHGQLLIVACYQLLSRSLINRSSLNLIKRSEMSWEFLRFLCISTIRLFEKHGTSIICPKVHFVDTRANESQSARTSHPNNVIVGGFLSIES